MIENSDVIDVGLKMDPDKAEKRKGAYQCHECDDEFQTNKKLLIHKATKHSATDKEPIINLQNIRKSSFFNIKSKVRGCHVQYHCEVNFPASEPKILAYKTWSFNLFVVF